MKKLLFAPASPRIIELTLCCVRIGLGILTIFHGLPKIMGGIATWEYLGSTMGLLGIHFLPIMWGFIAACTEFFGGILFALGLGTRIASLLITLMMVVALIMHLHKGDPFTIYSFAITLIVVFLGFLVIGGGRLSIDYYLSKK